uniref:Transmembrane protein n=1 Tax=Heterorhabditis bacteriophora TaxID=37862 RepID=A0A1I7WX78_HETBA
MHLFRQRLRLPQSLGQLSLQLFPDYEPLRVANRKALVSKDKSVNNATVVVTQVTGSSKITKLVTMDLLMTIAAILVIDFFRGLACRYWNMWWFWDLEKTFVGVVTDES